jgi:phage-related protein
VDTIVITDVFKKKTQATSKHVIEACQQRLREYDKLGRG